MTVTLTIESSSRWDALALARKLSRYHWFMFEPDSEHWDVCIPMEGDRCDELPRDLFDRLHEWLVERHIDAAEIHTPSRDFVLTQ